ncbi:MAG: hypothetical protein ACOCP8_03095 [archaeon]
MALLIVGQSLFNNNLDDGMMNRIKEFISMGQEIKEEIYSKKVLNELLPKEQQNDEWWDDETPFLKK